MDQHFLNLKEDYPLAWDKWKDYAMKIPREDFHSKDWFAEFFKEENIGYTIPSQSFEDLEKKLNKDYGIPSV